jgi:hypothetical protein
VAEAAKSISCRKSFRLNRGRRPLSVNRMAAIDILVPDVAAVRLLVRLIVVMPVVVISVPIAMVISVVVPVVIRPLYVDGF